MKRPPVPCEKDTRDLTNLSEDETAKGSERVESYKMGRAHAAHLEPHARRSVER